MYLTVRIVCQYILSRVGVSVRPSNFFIRLNFQNLWEIGWPVRLFISMSRRSAIVPPASERVRPTMTESWLGSPKQRTATVVRGGVRVRQCARAYVRACVRACVRDVFAILDDNILSRLIMIINKIIILYFIQIRHTDDFPSAGITASLTKYG